MCVCVYCQSASISTAATNLVRYFLLIVLRAIFVAFKSNTVLRTAAAVSYEGMRLYV